MVKAGERVAIPPGVVAPAVGEVSVTPAAGAKPEVHHEMPKRFLVVVGILLLLTVVIAIVVDRLQRWSMRT